MMDDKEKYNKGFTLIETLVALVIISIGLLSLGAFTMAVLSNDNVAVQRHGAANIAVEQLEDWPAGVVVGTPVIGTIVRNNVSYDWSASINSSNSVSSLNGAPDTRVITVTWDNRGDTKTVVVNSMDPAP